MFSSTNPLTPKELIMYKYLLTTLSYMGLSISVLYAQTSGVQAFIARCQKMSYSVGTSTHSNINTAIRIATLHAQARAMEDFVGIVVDTHSTLKKKSHTTYKGGKPIGTIGTMEHSFTQTVKSRAKGRVFPQYKLFDGLNYHYNKSSGMVTVMAKYQCDKTIYKQLTQK